MKSRKILVGLDGSNYSKSAIDHAINLFKEDDAEQESLLVGVYVQNLHYGDLLQSVKEHEPLYYQYKDDVFEFVDEEQGEKRGEVIDYFKDRCADANVRYAVHNDKGAPVVELLNETKYADLLLLGFQTYFANEKSGDNLLHELLKDAHCPVLVVPEEYKAIENVVMTYDGKDSSFYAIKQFCYNFSKVCMSMKTTVLSVYKKEEQKLAEEEEGLILEYLDQHCEKPELRKVQGDPEDVILDAMEFTPNSMLVMGSYGRSSISMLFSPSTADKVLKFKKVPIFITHK